MGGYILNYGRLDCVIPKAQHGYSWAFTSIDAFSFIKMNTRQRMRFSNRKAVLWLLESGYDEIWLKPHIRRSDLVYTVGEWYRALDLWNLFDGICFDAAPRVLFCRLGKKVFGSRQKSLHNRLVDNLSKRKTYF